MANTPPVISNARIITINSKAPRSPTIAWDYSDADTDPIYSYKVEFGTVPAADDLYNTTVIIANPIGQTSFSHTMPTQMSYGQVFYWTLTVSDGTDDTVTTGTETVLSTPVLSGVTVDSQASPAPDVSVKNPVFAWVYTAQVPQKTFELQVGQTIDSVFSAFATVTGTTASNVSYPSSAQILASHTQLSFQLSIIDEFDNETTTSGFFTISAAPVVSTLRVNNSTNPINVKGTPTFSWTYSDIDSDVMSALEIRVGSSDTNIGTDSFTGNLWASGKLTTNVRSIVYAGSALSVNVPYYFQLRAYDSTEKLSTWKTGSFKKNNPPTATNVLITPTLPNHNQSLNATYTFNDDATEVESDRTLIKWYKNSILVTSLENKRTVPTASIQTDEVWFFRVNPNDGTDYGYDINTPSSWPQSPAVTILNHAPVATIIGEIGISPEQPQTEDDLNALFLLNDEDGDQVAALIKWYKNGVEQIELTNSYSVPSSMTSLNDQWYFAVTPFDGIVNGDTKTSGVVTVLNTQPTVIALMVEGEFLPKGITTSSPTFSWTYQDVDLQAQSAYQLVIGTRPLRTSGVSQVSSAIDSESTGIAFVSGSGTTQNPTSIVAGNEVFDSGVISSAANSFKYLTQDILEPITLGVSDLASTTGLVLDSDGRTMMLAPGKSSGEAIFNYSSTPGIYILDILSVGDKRQAKFSVYIDDVKVGETISQKNAIGSQVFSIGVCKLNTGSTVKVAVVSFDPGAGAKISNIRLTPKGFFQLLPQDFTTLSGYAVANNELTLTANAGTASVSFPYPTGTYSVDVSYVCESIGSCSATLVVGSTSLAKIDYEALNETKIRTFTDVSISKGDAIKVIGQAGASSAKIERIAFRPQNAILLGNKLNPGFGYFASLRVHDGIDWSNWYTTRFSMSGSAWASSVSNETGWTIEVTLKQI